MESFAEAPQPEVPVDSRLESLLREWPPRGPEYGEALCRVLTGLSLDDPSLPARLLQDRAIVRARYGLPERTRGLSPSEYEARLRRWVEREGAKLRPKSDRGRYFATHPGSGAIYSTDNKTVYADVNVNGLEGLRSLGVLEHEAIHAAQKRHSPSMPIEVMEYEAYVAGFNERALRDPKIAKPDLFTAFFQHMVGGSVDGWYREESRSRGVDARPDWAKLENQS